MPALKHRRARLWPVVLASCLALLLLAVVWKLSEHAQLSLWREQLAQITDEQARGFFHQAIRTHAAGSQLCLFGLTSERNAVVAAAQEALYEEAARWQLLPMNEATAHRHELAMLLADQIDTFSPRGRRAASEMAALLLSAPSAETPQQRREITLACQRILDAAITSAARAPIEASVAASTAAPRPHRFVTWEAEPTTDSNTDSPFSKSASASAADGAPPALATPPAAAATRLGDVKPHENPAADMAQDLRASARLEAASTAPRLLPLDMSEARPLADATVATASPSAEPHNSGVQEPRRFAPPADMTAISGTRTDVDAAGVVETRLETMRLVERLHDPNRGPHARQELARRGLTRLELELAERLSDPSAATRLRWLEALPGINGIDARPWLLWLSRDADAEVRLTALGLMATSNEPEMLRRVGEMAREEIDPRVKEQAARITERQQSRRR